MVIGGGQNVPVLQLPLEVHMRPCDTEVKCLLPCVSYESVKLFKKYPSMISEA